MRSTAELMGFLPSLDGAPTDVGTVEMVLARPAEGERLMLTKADLDLTTGLVGDRWAQTEACASGDTTEQLNVMSARMVRFLADEPDRQALAGDQLYLDLDLSHDNLPAGTRIHFGDPGAGGAVIEVTPEPHTGCSKFIARFGVDAMRFVNGREGRPRRLRGLNARVVVPGQVRLGDQVTVERLG